MRYNDIFYTELLTYNIENRPYLLKLKTYLLDNYNYFDGTIGDFYFETNLSNTKETIMINSSTVLVENSTELVELIRLALFDINL